MPRYSFPTFTVQKSFEVGRGVVEFFAFSRLTSKLPFLANQLSVETSCRSISSRAVTVTRLSKRCATVNWVSTRGLKLIFNLELSTYIIDGAIGYWLLGNYLDHFQLQFMNLGMHGH